MNNEILDEDGFPRVKPGYTRVWTDHTGRWYEDIKNEELNNDTVINFNTLVTKEIDREIIKDLLKIKG